MIYVVVVFKFFKSNKLNTTDIIYKVLMERDIKNYDWTKEMPKTEAHYNNIDKCIDPLTRFLASLVVKYDGKYQGGIMTNTSNDINSEYERFGKKAISENFQKNPVAFGISLGKIKCITKKESRGITTYTFNIPQLKEYLVNVKKFEFGRYQIIDLD